MLSYVFSWYSKCSTISTESSTVSVDPCFDQTPLTHQKLLNSKYLLKTIIFLTAVYHFGVKLLVYQLFHHCQKTNGVAFYCMYIILFCCCCSFTLIPNIASTRSPNFQDIFTCILVYCIPSAVIVNFLADLDTTICNITKTPLELSQSWLLGDVNIDLALPHWLLINWMY